MTAAAFPAFSDRPKRLPAVRRTAPFVPFPL